MAQARFLFLYMQKRFYSLRFDPTCNAEKAGDVVESTGSILSPWRASAGVVLRYLTKMFSLSRDDVLETGEAMGAFARQVKILYAHICRNEPIENARVPKIYATILQQIVPAIEPCRESVCVCVRSASLWPRCLRRYLWPPAPPHTSHVRLRAPRSCSRLQRQHLQRAPQFLRPQAPQRHL